MLTMTLDQLRTAIETGGVSEIVLKANAGAFVVEIETLRGHAVLVKSRRSAAQDPVPRSFTDPRKALLVLHNLGVDNLRVDSSEWQPDDKTSRTVRPDRSAALKEVHEAKAYADWVEAKVKSALADTRPPIPHDEVMRSIRDIIDRAKKQHAELASNDPAIRPMASGGKRRPGKAR